MITYSFDQTGHNCSQKYSRLSKMVIDRTTKEGPNLSGIYIFIVRTTNNYYRLGFGGDYDKITSLVRSLYEEEIKDKERRKSAMVLTGITKVKNQEK
jgi:hypothetical protein